MKSISPEDYLEEWLGGVGMYEFKEQDAYDFARHIHAHKDEKEVLQEIDIYITYMLANQN